jgi:hypothetical protein
MYRNKTAFRAAGFRRGFFEREPGGWGCWYVLCLRDFEPVLRSRAQQLVLPSSHSQRGRTLSPISAWMCYSVWMARF